MGLGVVGGEGSGSQRHVGTGDEAEELLEGIGMTGPAKYPARLPRTSGALVKSLGGMPAPEERTCCGQPGLGWALGHLWSPWSLLASGGYKD